ncbi:hypothetical protein QCA50_019981 [Cerrena zonata]|uniref:Protein kinase domain-containing protein n=1 Tax=Cerrena zonata TaxID=2478898 RepID=A0AAW0F9U0_9APHY
MSLLKLMQRTLDHHRRNTDEPKFLHGNHLGRLIVKLSRRSQVIPDSLHITGVEDVSHDVYECGGFADIFIAKWNQQSVALKRLRIFKSTHNDSSVREAFYREAIVWRQLEHRFILPFYGIDNETFSNAPTMVSPLILGGNVHKAMLTLSPNDIPYNRWLLEISQGLEYLHDQDIVHGDVRGANILIDSQGHVKMADFGLAFFSGASTVSFGPNAGGATRWLAPELLEVEDKVRLPTYACDVFSFGRVCIELYTRQKPFPDIILDIQVTPHVIRGGCPVRPSCETGQEMSEELWELAQSCWSKEPTHRPTISQVVQNLSAQLV